MMCSFQDRDNLYLVMDLLTGGDLRYHICHKKKFSEEQTKFFLACVILGLEYNCFILYLFVVLLDSTVTSKLAS